MIDTYLSEVTGMVLVEQNSVMMLATGVTTPACYASREARITACHKSPEHTQRRGAKQKKAQRKKELAKIQGMPQHHTDDRQCPDERDSHAVLIA